MWFLELIALSACVSFSNTLGFFDLNNDKGIVERKLKLSRKLLDVSMISEKRIQQPLDHFNANDSRTWAMRYFERIDLWQPNGPIYLYINGEAAASDSTLHMGTVYDLAKETKGAIYISEHRYYGESMPFDNLTTENLAYLSSRQALADVENLLKMIKSNSSFTNSKVVVVGGSYAGNLAAWMKVLYPDLVDAVIASSAPVLAKKDYYEYMETVGTDFKKYGGKKCYNKIKLKFNRYADLLKSSDGIATLKKEKNICDRTDMTNLLNQQMLFLNELYQYATAAQYDPPEEIKYICKRSRNCYDCDLESNFKRTTNATRHNRISDALWNEKDNCVDCSLDAFVKYCKTDIQSMSWIYQTCTEFGYFQTTTHNRHPFTDNIHPDVYINMCLKLYGSQFNENRIDKGITNTNQMYGGLRPNVTNVVFVNGDKDPWHRLGVVKDMSDNVKAIVIPGSFHCMDLQPDMYPDFKELQEAVKHIKLLIKSWIGVGNDTSSI